MQGDCYASHVGLSCEESPESLWLSVLGAVKRALGGILGRRGVFEHGAFEHVCVEVECPIPAQGPQAQAITH